MELSNGAYKAGKEFGEIILQVYQDKHRWMSLRPANVVWSEDYACLRLMFGSVDEEMEAEYFRGFDEIVGVTHEDRLKHGLYLNGKLHRISSESHFMFA
ncbi:MAG: hypothetical protein V4443_01840 [Pseudomonadota bacterium]